MTLATTRVCARCTDEAKNIVHGDTKVASVAQSRDATR
jgi:hypothetical protein